MKRSLGIACLAGYILSIYAANWLLVHVGFVTVWPGVSAPAGVYAAGFAFTFRDLTQTTSRPSRAAYTSPAPTACATRRSGAVTSSTA